MANRMVWDDAAHLRLLLTIIAQNDVTPNYKAVAAAFGNGVTTNILAQRMCALRKKAFAITAESSGAIASATTPKKRTGRPPKAKSDNPSSATTTPSKRGKKGIKKQELSSDEDEDNSDMFSGGVAKVEGDAAPTTPPQTPGKLTKPCTPSRATVDGADKIISGRIEKRQPRVSPRKRNVVATYADDGELGDLLNSEDDMEGESEFAHSLGEAVSDEEESGDEFSL